MNRAAKQVVMNRLKGDHRSGMDYRDNRDYRDYRGYNDYAEDGRRGVKYSGPYGMDRADGGSGEYYGTYSTDHRGYNDYANGMRGNIVGTRIEDRAHNTMPYPVEYDHTDMRGGDMMDMHNVRLMPHDMEKWKESMKNADGSKGEHFRKEQVMQIADKIGVKFHNYDEKEFCMVMNMMYSDYCEALRGMIVPDKEVVVYAKLAKAWLEDEDAPQGSEKLAMYYYCIIEKDDEDHRRGRY